MNEDNENLQTSAKPLSTREVLHQTALKAPNQSGVYMWRNEGGTIIYVGKAKNLKNRLTSYFSGKKDIKTRLLISRAKSIEYITTGNEYEAFLLENNLIKKHNPRYNICLKDGKSYPVLKITKEKFPRLYKTRNVARDGSLYFGPFPDAAALDTFIETLYDIYPLRHCKKFRQKDSGCLYYHMGKCLGPCFKKNEDSSYSEFIGEITSLLEGKEDKVKKLEEQMKQAARELNFEKAARLRDGLKALSIMQNQNIVEGFDQNDRDYIATWREGELVSFTILKMRSGKLLGRDNYRTLSLSEDTELIPEFMSAYYTEKEVIPPSIYVISKDGTDFMKRWIKETYNIETEIIPVDESEKMRVHRAAVNMAQQNAKEDIIRRLRERGDFPAMEELKKELGLNKLPVRIEGFDIAHIGGKFPVASLISFYNGNPDKKNYRYFRLKTTDGLIDDFASMKEAVSRRYTRLLNENAELPDLLLIDGGIGQVNAVDSILQTLGLDIPIAGLAKRDEEIWRPHTSQPICLPKRSDALRLLQRVRDETHRFATSRNQELRTKENTISVFSKIPGIGAKREAMLIKKYGTLASLAATSEADVAQTLGIRADAASEILLNAKKLYIEQKEKQEKQKESLGMAGTTKEKAARLQINHNLAAMALLEVASPDENTKENK
ncbi:MAG: excinuclease ABC subunit UvrC [Spirochaetales bacterium]|nr:excinuclease ABC subunit UvrC [Spirochaetia bacterium]MDD7460841.1 excinuclease ABC subunit UvrC [Spirochaetales bacterium]